MKKELYEFHKLEQEKNWWFKARKNIVTRTLNKHLSKNINKILEIGCGYGIMTNMLNNYGMVDGIEPYADCYNYLKENVKGNFIKKNISDYNTRKKYDVVALFDVLEHIKEESKTVSKINSLLKPKGKVILTVPAYMFLWSHHDDTNKHYRRYTKTSLKKLFEKNGFKIKKISYFNTILFPLAFVQKITQNKKSKTYNPNKILNSIFYTFFNIESSIIPNINLPFGVSLLLIAEKK